MHRTSVKTFCTRLLATLSLALLLGGLVAPAASAGDRWTDIAIDAMMLQWGETCTQNGGQATITYDFGTNGSVNWASLTCHNQTSGSWGKSWNCIIYDDELFWSCSPGLTRPPETIAQSVTAQDGTVVEAVEVGSHDTPTPVVIDRGTAGPTAPERPISQPEPTPTDQDDDRTP